jgi:hydrogenase/urease accessory protein HupE
MATTPPRARSHPGPRTLGIALVCIVGLAVPAGAHDPGLSAVDIVVSGNHVSAVLTVARADAQPLASGSKDLAAALAGIAVDTIAIASDGRTLPGSVVSVASEDDAVRVRLGYAGTVGKDATLTVVSQFPARLARGHRQFVTVREGRRIRAERLLDARSGPLVLARPSDAGRRDMGTTASAMDLFTLGIEHILRGYDHLLFVGGLVLAARRTRQLLGMLTAFTVSHSVTLGAAALGLVHAPAAIVEPIIAVSIAWVGVENLLPAPRLRLRWAMVFAFGLAHGFGFAEALTGLDRESSSGDAMLGLLAFTAGVEAAQLGAAVTLLPLVVVVRKHPTWSGRIVTSCSLLVAAAGVAWLFQRL